MELKGNFTEKKPSELFSEIGKKEYSGNLHIVSLEGRFLLKFHLGKLVFAGQGDKAEPEQFKELLLVNNKITREQWILFESSYRNSLYPFWNLLAKTIPLETASELLERHIKDIFFAAIRLTEGEYVFSDSGGIEYPEHLAKSKFVAELIPPALEAAKEYEAIAKNLPPSHSFLERVSPADWANDDDDTLKVIPAEEKVLKALTKPGRIEDVKARSDVSELEFCSALVSLIGKGLVAANQSRKELAEPTAVKNSILSYGLIACLAILFAGMCVLKFLNLPYQLAEKRYFLNEVLSIAVEKDIGAALYPLQVWHMETGGSLPETIGELTRSGLADKSDFRDIWGRNYEYALFKESFALYSKGADESHPADDIFLPRPTGAK